VNQLKNNAASIPNKGKIRTKFGSMHQLNVTSTSLQYIPGKVQILH